MSGGESVLAIIPARGGSKGIPGKNLRPLAGRPLLAHTIEHARGARSVSRTVVSTDSAEIANVADSCGAEVVWRPEEISGDDASSESSLIHCLDHLKAAEGYSPDLVVFLQATAPLRTCEHIEEAIATLAREGADSLLSAYRLRGFVWRRLPAGVAPLGWDPRRRPRRQEAAEDYVENGSIYVLKPWVLRELKCRLGGRIAVYVMDRLDSIDIDEPEDLATCELLFRHRHSLGETRGS